MVYNTMYVEDIGFIKATKAETLETAVQRNTKHFIKTKIPSCGIVSVSNVFTFFPLHVAFIYLFMQPFFSVSSSLRSLFSCSLRSDVQPTGVTPELS